MLGLFADADRAAADRLRHCWASAVWFIFTLMLAQAINLSVAAFFERGDLDLVLASPLAPRHVFLVRGLGVAISSVAIYALAAHAVRQRRRDDRPRARCSRSTRRSPRSACSPPPSAWRSPSSLVRLLGARRARIVAQVLGALVGAALFLGLSSSTTWSRRSERSAGVGAGSAWRADGAALDRDGLVWLPLNALLGQPLRAARAASLSASARSRRSRAPDDEAPRRRHAGVDDDAAARTVASPRRPRFRAGLWRNVLVKEWKLIARDPQLIAHTLLQSLYMLPLAFAWVRATSSPQRRARAGAGRCSPRRWRRAWSGSPSPPRTRPSCSPRRRSTASLLRRAKLVAALAPVWLIMLPLALVLARVERRRRRDLRRLRLGATISAGSIHLLLPRPGRRRDLSRRASGNLLGSVLELATDGRLVVADLVPARRRRCTRRCRGCAIAALLAAWLLGRERRAQARRRLAPPDGGAGSAR